MSSDTNDSLLSPDIDDQDSLQKWHKNYTRLMPYYYVNHKAKYSLANGSQEKLVRVRKVTKTRGSLILEIAEKDNTRKKKQKITQKEILTIPWNDLEEINLTTLKTNEWILQFIK